MAWFEPIPLMTTFQGVPDKAAVSLVLDFAQRTGREYVVGVAIRDQRRSSLVLPDDAPDPRQPAGVCLAITDRPGSPGSHTMVIQIIPDGDFSRPQRRSWQAPPRSSIRPADAFEGGTTKILNIIPGWDTGSWARPVS